VQSERAKDSRASSSVYFAVRLRQAAARTRTSRVRTLRTLSTRSNTPKQSATVSGDILSDSLNKQFILNYSRTTYATSSNHLQVFSRSSIETKSDSDLSLAALTFDSHVFHSSFCLATIALRLSARRRSGTESLFERA
jgi:hypothetical protein